MKMHSKNIKENNLDTVRITPEDDDDLWVLYNLMVAGNTLISETTRKTQLKSGKGGGREKIIVEISIHRVDYEKDSSLRVIGRAISGEKVDRKEAADVAGSHHTIVVEPGKQIKFRKKKWDSTSAKALLDCCNRTAGADVAVKTTKAVKDFLELTRIKPDHTCSGPKPVEMANEWDAIETLLITDHLYRSSDVETRRKYMKMADSVKQAGGKVLVVSPEHVSGEQLDQLAGIAAILRYPIANIDEQAL